MICLTLVYLDRRDCSMSIEEKKDDIVQNEETASTEKYQLVVNKIDNKYIVIADGLESELSDIIGEIKNFMGESNIFVVDVDREVYEDKRAYIDILNDYIDSILKS